MNLTPDLSLPASQICDQGYTPDLTLDENFLDRVPGMYEESYYFGWTLRHNHGLDDHMLLAEVLSAIARSEFACQPEILGGRHTDLRARLPHRRRKLRFLLLELRAAAQALHYSSGSEGGDLRAVSDPFALMSYGYPVQIEDLEHDARMMQQSISYLANVKIRPDVRDRPEPSLSKVAYPILLVEGVAGSAKSNLGDKTLALVDPPIGDRQAARFSMAEEERNLHIQASRCSMLYLDNISVFSAEVADQLCRLCSGAASSHRVLHSNDAEQLFFVRRPCIVSCIATPSNRGDLLSRSLRITATPLEKRLTEAAVWRAFDADAGHMVGFLLDCVSAGLRNRSAIAGHIESGALALPRLADFAAWVEAAGEPMGLNPGEFAALLNEEQESMQRKAVDGHPLIDALCAYFQNPDAAIEGRTARDLRDTLSPYDRTNSLPAVNQFSTVFRRLAEGLRASGFEILEGRDGKRKVTTFSIVTNEAFERGADGDGGGGEIKPAIDDDPLPF